MRLASAIAFVLAPMTSATRIRAWNCIAQDSHRATGLHPGARASDAHNLTLQNFTQPRRARNLRLPITSLRDATRIANAGEFK
jgi:hypothetical protein